MGGLHQTADVKKLSRRIVAIDADPNIWELFDRYLVVINDKLSKRKWPKVNQPRLVGAVLSYLLLSHQKHILDSYDEVKREEVRKQLGKYFSPTDLSAIGLHQTGRGGAEDADVLRTGGAGQDPSGAEASKGAL